jgi:KUP system potassium uptake protein
MQDHNKQSMTAVTLAAMGVVYGDIGTSPLYTLSVCFAAAHLPLNQANIFGILSLIFWAILLVVTVKYVAFILRADNRGEGGIMVLMALARRYMTGRARKSIIMLGLFGAALFYGDAIITPAVSVLSACEGLKVINPAMAEFVMPMAIVVLVGLFLLQRVGTASVGRMFGPVMLIWFIVIALLGARSILHAPQVLAAINPWYGIQFISAHHWGAFLTLGAVVLALTGGEALYADMGHFGRKPIQHAWFAIVLPALVLNYFGQGALLLLHPEAIANPFFMLAPKWGLLPLIILATFATVIASQAVISGAFSLTRQAIQLGYCPRMVIAHTSAREIGQIYLPFINWALLVAVLIVTVSFGSSESLAAAYGIAVTGTMVITSLLFFVVARVNWRWPLPLALGLTSMFLVIDLTFFSANVLKVAHGGWLPLLIGLAVFVTMNTWKLGRELLFERIREHALPLEEFIENIEQYPPTRVQGTAVFLTGTTNGVPHAMLHNLKHNKVLHERVVLLTIITEDTPYVDCRVNVTRLSNSFWRLVAHYGFMENPDIDDIVQACKQHELTFDLMDTSFFLSRETLISTDRPGMAPWREHLFLWMSKNALRATDFFQIPTNRVVELGAQIEL